MGLRGPGAKARPKIDAKPKVKTPAKLPWEKRGLSRVERVIAFLEFLPVTSGPLAGKPFRVRPWQRKFLERVYATDANDRRPIRTAVLSLGRKNGKSCLAAGLALCHLSGPEAEDRGEVYSAANDRFQAGRIFKEMCAVIGKVEYLSDRISIRRHSKELEDFINGSEYAALSADVATKDGLSPSFVIYDEYGSSRTRDLFDVLDTAQGGRAEPLMMVISTQAADDLAPMSELVDYGLKVEAGEVVDAAFHLTLYTAPPEADPWQLSTWRMANPALGDFRSLEDVERQALQAQKMPSKAAAFQNKILNMRVASESAFILASEWDANDAEPEDEGGDRFGGLDLAATRDLTSFVWVEQGEGGVFNVHPTFWLPEEHVDQQAEYDRVPYRVWQEKGLLRTTPGKTLDPAYVAHFIAELNREREFVSVAYDPWRIEDFRRQLDRVGGEDVNLEAHGQGYRSMPAALDALERCVAERLLRHGGNPILRWCIGNARVEIDPAGNRKLSKKKSTGRIDGAQALAMALNHATRGVVEEPEPEFQMMFA